MKPMSKTIVLSMILLLLVVSSWMIYTYYSQSPAQVVLLVYTPPSIQPLLNNASREYMQLHPNVRIEIIGGATGTLLNKILLTGEGDVFITADHEYMLNASRMGLVVNESIKVLSYIVLALIIPRGNPANITSLDDLVSKNVKIGIANPSVAPFGRMAVELLVKNGIYDKVKDRLVIYGDVGQTARQVALGLVDAAILPHVAHYWYLNDTSIIWLNPAQLPTMSCQMIAVLNTTKNYQAALEFVEFLVEYVRFNPYSLENGYIGDLEKISSITPYRPEELLFNNACIGYTK